MSDPKQCWNLMLGTTSLPSTTKQTGYTHSTKSRTGSFAISPEIKMKLKADIIEALQKRPNVDTRELYEDMLFAGVLPMMINNMPISLATFRKYFKLSKNDLELNEFDQAILEQYRAKTSQSDIARNLNLSLYTVRSRLIFHGLLKSSKGQ